MITKPRTASSDELATTVPGTGFSRAAVLELSHAKNEPAWMRDFRLAAWDIYERTPMPDRRQEEWRRTDIRALDMESFAPYSLNTRRASTPKELPAGVRGIVAKSVGGKGTDDGGLLVQYDSLVSYLQLADELRQQGVIFVDLDTAVRDYPDLVRENFMTQCVKPDNDKFTALHAALWSGGSFVYVPESVEVTLPLRAAFWLSRPGLGLFAHTLLVADKWSQVTYIDEYLSPAASNGSASADGVSTKQGFNAGVVEVLAGEGAQVRYMHLQQFGQNVWNFTTERAILRRDSSVNFLQVGLGSKLTKANVQSLLAGPGSSAEMLGIYFASSEQHIDHHTLQDHQAPHTMSDLLYKGAVKDVARSVYAGLIHVRPGAQRADAYQNNRNLMLSSEGRADSIPQLEIEANDVRCTHGATAGPLDQEEVFYLQSRGLPRPEAERLIVEGFFQPVVERVPLASVRDRLNKAIAEKITTRGSN
ncbi:MAG TPA: Fe-S cluster assembly protein SufD [Chloroflexota bacterium]|nr:Fe-S cluster assembly protein SufD [Chloroflexota bacterium]